MANFFFIFTNTTIPFNAEESGKTTMVEKTKKLLRGRGMVCFVFAFLAAELDGVIRFRKYKQK